MKRRAASGVVVLALLACGASLGALPAAAQCPINNWPEPFAPESASVITSETEFWVPDSFRRFELVRTTSDAEAVALIEVEGATHVLRPASELVAGASYTLSSIDSFCEGCGGTVAGNYTVGEVERPTPPAPTFLDARLELPFDTEPCFQEDFFGDGSERTLVVDTGDPGAEPVRLEIDLTFLDPEVNLTQIVSVRPPVATHGSGAGAVVPNVHIQPGTEVELRLRYVNLDGVAGPEHTATWVAPLVGGCGPGGSADQVGGPPPPGVVVGVLVGAWRLRRAGRPKRARPHGA